MMVTKMMNSDHSRPSDNARLELTTAGNWEVAAHNGKLLRITREDANHLAPSDIVVAREFTPLGSAISMLCR